MHNTEINQSVDDDENNNSGFYPTSARESRHTNSRGRKQKQMIEMVPSKNRQSFKDEALDKNFKEEKEEMILKLKGFNTVEDDGFKFLVGEYEKAENGSDNEENISTRDKIAGENELNPAENQQVLEAEPISIDVENANEIKSYGDGGICSICFTFEPDAVYMNCGHGGRVSSSRSLLSVFSRYMGKAR